MTAPTLDPLAPEDIDGGPDEAPDPDAPYGRNPKTGKPYSRPPEWRAKLAETLARGRATQAAKAPARKAAPKAKAKADGGNDYRVGVLGLLQVPAFALGMASRWNPKLGLDAAAIGLHAPALADAVAATAAHDDRLAAVLDRVLAVGPYGALLGALLPLGLQLAANHGAIPAAPEAGILGPEQLLQAAGAAAGA